MAVLDTFYILFKTDAGDAEKGVKKAKGAVDDLESGIGGADKASIQLGKKFNTLATQAVAAFGAVFAVTQLISSARGIAEQSSELGVLSDVLGESASEIVNWGRAVQNMGGDSKAFQGSLRSLSGSLNDALVNGPNAATDALAKMGVSARDAKGDMRTVLDILPDVARELSGLTRESALARGATLGLDAGTILLLMEGEEAVRGLVARQREMNTVSDEEIENLRLLNVKWDEYKNAIGDAGTEILSGLLPAFEGVEKGFGDFAELIRENEGLIMTFLKGAGVLVGALALKAAILAAPFLATVAAIGAVAFAIGALIEDFQKFSSGEDSIIGSIKSGVADKISQLRGLFGGDSDEEAGFGGIQGGLATMSATPLVAVGAQAAAGGAGSVSNRTASVNVGEITVETQATDAAGIAARLTSELEAQFSNAIEQNDDGIAA